MNRSLSPALTVAAALCAASAFATAPVENPQAGPVLPRISPSSSRFASLPPEEREHVRRMAEFRKAYDAAANDIIRIRREIEARREEILAENPEAKALFDETETLFAEYSAKTNALQNIFENDEKIAALFKEMEPAKVIVESNQQALNAEVAAAMRLRMKQQREKAEAAGALPPPRIESNVTVRAISAVDSKTGKPISTDSERVQKLVDELRERTMAEGAPAATAPASSFNKTSDER